MRRGTAVALALFLLGASIGAAGVAWSPGADCESGYHLNVAPAASSPPADADTRRYDALPGPARAAFDAALAGTPVPERTPLTRTYDLDGAFVRHGGETYRVDVLVRDCRYVYPNVLGRLATAGGFVLAAFVGTVWAFWRFAFVPATAAERRRREQ